jgi:DNA topoisomerase-1
LRKRNVAVDGSELKLRFIGKGGTEYRLSLRDARAARALRRCHELPGQRLFRYLDENQQTRAISSGDINTLLEELTGQKFTAKDFRTWAGTVYAFGELIGRERGASEVETARIVNEVGVQTAEVLGNTLAVCKRYYVHPKVLEAFAVGKLEHVRAARASRRGMSRVELALAKFLAGDSSARASS